MSNVTMLYGAYEFNPVPMISFARDYRKTEDGRILNAGVKMLLDGTLVTTPNGSGGLDNLLSLKELLGSGLNQQGCSLVLKCDSTVLISVNPQLNSLQFKTSPNNWLTSVGYNVELEYLDSTTGVVANTQYIDSIGESWNIESMEDKSYYNWTTSAGQEESPYVFKIAHQLSAKGRAHFAACDTFAGTGAEPWQNARDFCSANLGTINSMNTMLNIPLSYSSNLYNYNRVQNTDKYAGSYTVSENWLLFNSGVYVPGAALENYTIDIKQATNTNLTSVGIQGSVQGLEKVSYTGLNDMSKTIEESKYTSAMNYWSAIQGKLLARAQYAYQTTLPTEQRVLNGTQVSKTVGVNPINGVVNYSYEWTNMPSPCIEGALSESVTFDYSFPTDKFASIDVLGRGNGPVIQLMNSRSPYELTVNVDILVLPETGCVATWVLGGTMCPHSKVKDLLTTIEGSIYDAYTTVVKTSDKPSWNPKTGSYRRSVSWLYNNCTETATTVSGLM
jgi:hypothetical protein